MGGGGRKWAVEPENRQWGPKNERYGVRNRLPSCIVVVRRWLFS